MWSQWPTAAVPSAPPPQPSIPPPLPDAPPPPPPVDNAPAAGPLTSTAVTSAMPGSYVSTGAAQSASNPYEQYTADQYAAMTPEQQYALQQHWQQWQTYQQEYAKWHAQYGEQYKREMAAAAATSTAVPQPAVAPAVQPIGPVYQPAQIGPQMPVQQAQPQNYYSQTPMQPLPSQVPMQMPAQMPTQMPTQIPTQMPPQSQTTMPGKIMAQPQMYNQPPPPPPHAYQPQQHLSQPYQQPLTQPPAQNQWQQPPAVPPGRVSQMPPVTYTQPANAGGTGGFPNMQQPPPSFMQQPPPTASAPTLPSSNTIDPPWSKETPNRSNDAGNMGSDVAQPPRNNRWQGNEPVNNNSFNNTGNNMNNQNVNKPNQFGERRSWSGNNNNNNTRNNPFNTGSSNKFGSDDGEAPSAGNFDRDTDTGNSGNFGGQSGNNARYGNKLGNNSFGQEQNDNFGQGNRRSGRWEPNRSNQSGGNFGPPRNNNNNRGQNHPNQPHYTQQQQQQQQQQELNFDRLFQQWEKQFEDWKRANANHPDRDEYRRYEEEFENQRRRIAERREQMRRKMQNLHQQQQQQQPPTNQQEPHQQQPHRQQQQNQQSHQQQQHQLQRQPYQQQPAFGSGGNRFASNLEIGEGYDDEDDNSSSGDIDQRQEQKQPQYPDTKKPSDMLNDSAKSDSHFASLNKGAQQRQPQQPAVTKQQQQQQQQQPSLQQKPQQTSPQSAVATPSNQISQQHNQHIEKKTTANPNPNSAPPSDTGAGAGMGKRKVDAVRATPVKQDNILIISLDDDDDEVDEVQQQSDNDEESANDTPIKNIFKKSGGIPGLDLVTDAGKTGAGAVATPGSTKPTNQNVDNNKKIPSLFDVVIPNPSDSTPSQQSDKEVSTVKIDGESLPDTVTNALKDPNFMNNLSQALAQAQGREREQQQQTQESKDSSDQANNTSASGRALSFAEWKNNQKNSQKNGQRNNPDDDVEPGLGQIDNEKGNRGPDNRGFGPDQGPPHGFNPNSSMSSDVAQVAGPNSTDFSGPPQGDFRGNGPPNRPNFGGPNSGGPNFGPQGPGGFGGGPGPNGPFGRNFGPPGPNFNGPNGPGPNFGQQFPGNGPGSGPGPFRSNYCGPNGPGPGQNFGGPGPFDGPFDRNFGQGPNGPNDRNFGPGRGPNNQNFNNNNRNNSVSENPFKRKGPPMPNFDDGPRNGPGFGQRGRGQMRNFGPSRNNDNNNQWNDGGRSFRGGGVGQGNTFNRNNRNMQQQRGRSAENNFNNIQQCNDSVYRPMQVFDYQNSRNTTPQVIDYGHKSADSAAPRIGMGIGGAGTSPAVGNASALPHFRPGVSFDYGHASHNAPTVAGITGPGAGPINRKRKNKKRNKNRQRLLQQQQTQPQQPELQPNQDSTTSVDNECNDPEQTAAKSNSLEDISDGEEDSMATVPRVESPPPPPPKMPKQEKPKAFPANPQRRMLNDPLPALFPSTAEANKQLPQQTADVHRLEMSVPTNENRNTISIEEVLLPPGRLSRPKRICIILRGPPGCGKSYVARLIKDKELEMGGANPRVLSIDDYFIIENDYEEKCPKTGKKIPKKEMLYEYDAAMEETYMQYLIKSFKKTLTDNLYDFVIVDCNNNSLRTLNEFYCNAKDSNFVPYIVDMHCDVETCLGRNSHQRSEADIRAVLNNWCTTPFHYIKLDVSTLLENVIEMEDVEDMATDDNANSEQAVPDEIIDDTADDIVDDDSNSADTSNDCGFLKSKWESDNTEENLARLDGTKRLMEKRKTASMADYLQLDDWEPPKVSADGKKRVRWADIEEKRAQQKMRAIGFVVGQTDWKRMMDPNAGNRALNKTKYIERVNKRR